MSKHVFRVHGTHYDGNVDSWIIEGDTMEEVRIKGKNLYNDKDLVDAWSERISGVTA